MSSYHLKSFNNVHSFWEVHCNRHTTEDSVIKMTISMSACMINAPEFHQVEPFFFNEHLKEINSYKSGHV